MSERPTPSSQHAVQQLIEEVGSQNRRRSERQPYFQAVNVAPDVESGRVYSAYTRDISNEGIGLLHNMPLEIGAATLSLYDKTGKKLELRISIQWCQPASEGWFISGGKFLPEE